MSYLQFIDWKVKSLEILCNFKGFIIDFINRMKSYYKKNIIIKHYSKISLQKRLKLVFLVHQKGYSIAKAGRKLRIKPSTAKLILKKYRQEGKFFVPKAQKQQMTENVPRIQQQRIQTSAQKISFDRKESASKSTPQVIENLQILSVPQYNVYDGFERQYFLQNYTDPSVPGFIPNCIFPAAYPMVMFNYEWQ